MQTVKIEVRMLTWHDNVYLRKEDVAELIRESGAILGTDDRKSFDDLARRIQQCGSQESDES